MSVKLNAHHLSWYMQEICMHALGAHLAYQSLVTVLGEVETRQSRLVWFHLTSFLHHASMISKILAPISKQDAAIERRNALRDALRIAPESEVLSRDARDNIEHFDERMDRWIGDTNPTILEIVLENREGYEFLRVASKRVKRLLISDEMVYVSENRDSSKFELCLRPVYQEIDRVRKEAEKWMATKSPYEFIYPKR
jgi:hypothetical protein